jgi:hypothetical protein
MRDAERIAVGTLLFGPGERLADLMTLVAASAPGAAVRQLADLDELVEHRSDEGILLVDADVLPAEDVGYLRRFLARQEEFQLTLVGEDSSRRVARTLLRLPRVQWLGWPPDIDDLKNLVGVARGGPARTMTPYPRPAPPAPRAAPEAPRAVASPAPRGAEPVAVEQDELARIESILDVPDGSTEPETETAAPGAPPRAAASAADAGLPPAYFRDQVADLADIAQRIEGGVSSVRDGADKAGEDGTMPVEALANDVARLVQFTRTLSYLSAAPAQGDQVFDLAELVETLVAGLPKKGPKAPRWLARSSGPLAVASDRELLLQVFDALLFVAEKCSARGDIVRVQAAETKEAGPRRARVTIEFSSGPLSGLETAQILEPYGVRRILPDLGPNALSAARGIVAGQNGSLELEKTGRGRMTWIVDLPLTESPVAASAPALERKRPLAPDTETPGHASRGAADPFASAGEHA